MLISCDPGMGGGWSWKFRGKVYIENMQQTPKDLLEFLRDRALESDSYESVVCYLEKVGGYVSGNSATAAVKFSKHTGHIEMALIALNIKYIEVLPKKWMDFFIGKQKYPASMKQAQRKTKRKNLIKAKAQALYPNIKVTLAISDALGLLCYAEQTDNGM